MRAAPFFLVILILLGGAAAAYQTLTSVSDTPQTPVERPTVTPRPRPTSPSRPPTETPTIFLAPATAAPTATAAVPTATAAVPTATAAVPTATAVVPTATATAVPTEPPPTQSPTSPPAPSATPTPAAVPTPTLGPTPIDAGAPTGDSAILKVGNTDGEGVYLRRTPNLNDRIRPWRDGTAMAVIGPQVAGDGHTWQHVRAPDGAEGYIPAQYLTP